MCPRATTGQHCGDAMASVCSFVEEEYIDLDLSSCGEFEFRVRRSGAADELLCRGRLQPPPPPAAAAPHKAAPPRPGGKAQEVDVGAGGGCGGAGRRSAATVAPLQHSHSAGCRDDDTQPVARLRTECSRRRKAARTVHAKLLASRAFFRSLFTRTSCSDECRGAEVRASTRAAAAPPGETKSTACKAVFGQIKNGYGYGYHSGSGRAAPTTLRSSIEQEKLMDEEELAAAARQRKSFSGVIKWRHAAMTAAAPPAVAPAKPLLSSSARRSSWVGGGPALKRSSSARSEAEGLIQGAIAYCKRSQQQLGFARKSVSDSASAPSSWPSNPARSAVPVAYCH